MRMIVFDRPVGLGEQRSRTPQGWLVVHDAPVARTGPQIYGRGETPLDGDVVIIERDPEEVFHPATIASVENADVVNDHPLDGDGARCDITADNWRDLTVGHARDAKRGRGIDDDLLTADLVIKDPRVIDELETPGGKRQISMGYSAEYEPLGPGRGRQKNIICNHIALVDEARCGARCSIGDSVYVELADDAVCSTCGGACDRGGFCRNSDCAGHWTALPRRRRIISTHVHWHY